MKDSIKENMDYWDEAAKHHPKTDYYPVDEFKQGNSTLSDLVTKEVGEVKGESLLHLQCHIGLDTLSWARRGANVTGIDLSENAIRVAQELSEITNLEDNSEFIASDIYDIPDILKTDDRYDVIYTSFGVIYWLPDLIEWGEMINQLLKPDGIFYLAEFHPLMMTLPPEFSGDKIEFDFPYFLTEKPVTREQSGTYADRTAELDSTTTNTWPHSVSEIINSMIKNGLELKFVHEYPFIPKESWKAFEGLIEKENRYIFEGEIDIPLTITLKASKKNP